MDRAQWQHRLSRALLPLAALAVAAVLGKQWPKDQTVHYVLGDSAPRVQELDASWLAGGAHGESEESLRDVSFRYAVGRAPRVVTYEPRLPDGDYTVKIEIVAASRRSVVQRHVTLGGGSTSIDLTDSLFAQPDSLPRSEGTAIR
jgi:hypothetical protein